jgi:hypothetical protein
MVDFNPPSQEPVYIHAAFKHSHWWYPKYLLRKFYVKILLQGLLNTTAMLHQWGFKYCLVGLIIICTA